MGGIPRDRPACPRIFTVSARYQPPFLAVSDEITNLMILMNCPPLLRRQSPRSDPKMGCGTPPHAIVTVRQLAG
jgi:hypothetical protein